MAESKRLARLTSGVPGLDAILDGGFFETGVYVVEGAAGAGKTILANQIAFHLAAQKKRVVYYTLLTEAHDRMMGFLQGLGFYDPSLVPDGVSYVSGFKVLEAEGLPGVLRSVRDTVSGRKASLLVVDGIVSAEETAPSNTAFKKFLHELETVSAMYRCTVILLTNIESAQRLQAEHTMVDGILRLGAPVVDLKPQRTIEVIKFRGAGQVRGMHTLDIDASGIVVYPRVETLLSPVTKAPPSEHPRRPFGIARLDEMLGGGVFGGSNTMVLGPSGTGKTVLGLHFAAAGVSAGERSMFFTFYEQPGELLTKARRFGFDMDGAAERGDLDIVWQSGVEANLDKIGARLIGSFEKTRPTRIVIDGMHGFQVTSDPPWRIQDFFAALADYFTSRGAAMVFTCETGDLVGEEAIRAPFSNASRMCQNILLLRFTALRGQMTKVLSILKLRDSAFDASLREVTVVDEGFRIGEAVEEVGPLFGGPPRIAG